MKALEVLDAFTTAFNKQDSAGMDAALHFPHFIAGPKPVLWTKAGSLPASYFPSLLASGWAFSKYTKKEVVLQGADVVHVLVEYQRCREDGSVIGAHAALWILTRIDGRWGIQVRSAT